MSVFYDETGHRAAGAKKIAAVLQAYAELANKVTEDSLNFGLQPVTIEEIQDAARKRGQDAQGPE